MPGHLVGSAQQLATILRRHFVATGHPPKGSQWEIPCESSCNFHFASPHKWDEGSPSEISSHGHKRLADAASKNTFDLLLSDESWLIRDAIKHIPPVREMSAVMRDISSELEACASESPRLSYLFSVLCKAHVFTHWGFAESVDCETDIVTYFYTLTLAVVGPNFLHDLDSAILELQLPRATELSTGSDELTDGEIVIVQSIGDSTLTAEEIAKTSGYKNNSRFRDRLSQLVKRDVLEKVEPKGYRVKKKSDVT